MAKVHAKKFKKKSFITGRNRKKRPKTFKNEESAKRYAEKCGIKKYLLENLKSNESKEKKIRIKIVKS